MAAGLQPLAAPEEAVAGGDGVGASGGVVEGES